MKRRLAILVFLCLTLLMGIIYPDVVKNAVSREESLPPGITAPEKRLLRIWIMSDPVSASSWLRRQAAKLEKENAGISVYLRTALPQELFHKDAVLPDLIFFGPGVIKAPEKLFVPLSGDLSASDGALRAGKWQGQQYAVPVCMDGYTLVYDPAILGTKAATPAPTPLLGIGAARTNTPAPKAETSFDDLRDALVKTPMGKTAVCDFQSTAGMPLTLFTLLSGGKQGLPSAVLPTGFGSAAKETVLSDFVVGKSRAAVLLLSQLGSVTRQGKPFAYFSFPLPATDKYLCAGIVTGSGQDLAMMYLRMLLSPAGQQDLTQNGLMAVSNNVTLYGGDPVFGELEEKMQGDLILPNAFLYEEQQMKSVSLGLFTNGGAILEFFESIR